MSLYVSIISQGTIFIDLRKEFMNAFLSCPSSSLDCLKVFPEVSVQVWGEILCWFFLVYVPEDLVSWTDPNFLSLIAATESDFTE